MGKQNGAENFAFDGLKTEGIKQNGDSEQQIYCAFNGTIVQDVVEDEELEDNRPVWSNSIEFLMSCISMSVGLGNIWRFPFTAYENGGGAFLIPYIIVLILMGKPMYYLEMALGQFTSRSSIKIWELCPILRGVGAGQMLSAACVVSYYCSLMALTLFYLFASFTADLPWSECREEWGSQCVDSAAKHSHAISNITKSFTKGNQSVSSSELYFLNVVLKQKNGDISDGLGSPDWQLSLWLLLSWTVVFLVLIRGVKSIGKAAYFLALFPYVVMFSLLIRAATLEGAVNGIIFFIKPQWQELLNPKIWKEAVNQCFFSLGISLGCVVMFSSHNKFKQNIYRDAIIVTTLDAFTSLLAGFIIFGILGNLAHNLGIDDIDQVVKSGTGLAFISYPDAIAKFDVVPQLFSVLFFFMLFVLGIGSVVALHGSIITVICDQFRGLIFWQVALGASTCGYLIGLLYVTQGGQWMLNLVDYFGGTFLIFALAIVEMAGVFWIYGLEDFCLDVEFMVGRRVSIYWRICWGFVTPVLMAIIFIYSLAITEPLKYSGWYYPDSAYAAGWILLAIGLIQVPLWATWIFSRTYKDYSLVDKIKMLLRPSEKWGPRRKQDKQEWIKFKEEAKEQREKYNNSKLKHIMYSLLGKYR